MEYPMNNSRICIPDPYNEPVKSYGPGSPERAALRAELDRQMDLKLEIPLIIGGKAVTTERRGRACCPHDHGHELAEFSLAGQAETQAAIEAALAAKPAWEAMDWSQRAAIFLKAAELISGKYSALINAATMLNQSKNPFQAEIDATCEFADFLRFNVKYMEEIYAQQPYSEKGVWNRVEYRALEGFVFALTPFNFTAIAGNLCTAPAMMGNTVVWKPASTAVLSGYYLMQIFKEAGLPDGVINFIPGKGSEVGKAVLGHRELAGIHFTGSTGVFQTLWKQMGNQIDQYKSYPRIVGETGGKDYIFMHPSADAMETAVATVRGAFEYQGQKCSACSRLYVPASRWGEMETLITDLMAEVKTGPVTDFGNLVNAVIDENAFNDIMGYIERAEESPDAQVIAGGTGDKSQGYFIQPTLIRATDPTYESMVEEIFGPVLTVYVYADDQMDACLDILDSSSAYALTGAIFARDRQAVQELSRRLTHSAGNFYINDKPTGAVVGQQPFGGSRASGTNDKAGSQLNLLRWTSPRTIKETLVPPTQVGYPFMD